MLPVQHTSFQANSHHLVVQFCFRMSCHRATPSPDQLPLTVANLPIPGVPDVRFESSPWLRQVRVAIAEDQQHFDPAPGQRVMRPVQLLWKSTVQRDPMLGRCFYHCRADV